MDTVKIQAKDNRVTQKLQKVGGEEAYVRRQARWHEEEE
jgi:hypothetical protein